MYSVEVMSFHDTLLLALEALMHACQAVGTQKDILGVLEMRIHIPWYLHRVALRVFVCAAMKASHTRAITLKELACKQRQA